MHGVRSDVLVWRRFEYLAHFSRGLLQDAHFGHPSPRPYTGGGGVAGSVD
jgi:hypothetical protein